MGLGVVGINLPRGKQGRKGSLELSLPRCDRAPYPQCFRVVRCLRERCCRGRPGLGKPAKLCQCRCQVDLGRYSGQPQFDRRLMCRQSFLPAALLAVHAPQAVKNGRVLRMGLNGIFQRCQGFAGQSGGRIRVAKLDPIPLEARDVRAPGKGKRPLEQFRLVVRPTLQIAENLLGGGEPHVEL